MKYKFENIEYKINIDYDDTQHKDTGKFKYNKKLWENIIIFRNAKILPLLGCSKCIIQQKILKYDYIFEQFILSSLYLNNIIKRYNITDCLVITGTDFNFIESLLFYKIPKIKLLPIFNKYFTSIDFDYIIHKIKTIYNISDDFVIDIKATHKYNNIILYYVGNIMSNLKLFLWDMTSYYNMIYYITISLKMLNKGGNLIYRILYHKLDNYNGQILYLLSSLFKRVVYKKNNIFQKTGLKQLIIFEDFLDNNTDIFDTILDKLSDNQKQISNLIDIQYNSKYIKFVNKLDQIMCKNIVATDKIYKNKKNLLNNINDNDLKIIQNKLFLSNIDKCVYLCSKAKLEVKPEYIMEQYKYENQILDFILKEPEIIYHKLKKYYVAQSIYLTEDFTNLHENLYLINLYLQSKNKDKISYIIKKIDMSKFFIKELNNKLNYHTSIRFCEVFEILNNFELIKKNIKTIHFCEKNNSMFKAIKYLYKQINKTKLEDYVIFSLQLKKNILSENTLSYNKKHKFDKDYIINPEYIEYFTENFTDYDLLTFNYDKIETTPLILISQIRISLSVLKVEGSVIFKIYIPLLVQDFVSQYVSILYDFFDSVYFINPSINFSNNNYIYIVAKNKTKNLTNDEIKSIVSLNYKPTNTKFYPIVKSIIDNYNKYFNILFYYYDNEKTLVEHSTILKTLQQYFVDDWIKNVNIKLIS